MGAGFLSGWWKSSGTGRGNGCSILLNVLQAAQLFTEMVNFMWISPSPTKKTPHTQDFVLHHLKQKPSQAVWTTQNLVSTPLHCILVSWVIPLNHVVWRKSLQLCRLRGFLFHVLSGAALGIIDKMEPRPQTPLLVLQAQTRDEGVRPYNSDLFFPLLSWVDWKEILRCLLFLRGAWEAQSLLQLCSENNS